jgi:hypothetical protein
MAFVLAGIVGFLPHEIGRLVDPYDCYPSQFVATYEGPAIREHGRLFWFQCLPRLVAGAEMREFDRRSQRDDSIVHSVVTTLFDSRSARLPPIQEWFAAVMLVAFLVSIARLGFVALRDGDPCRRAIATGTTLSAVMIAAAFMINRNIFNSDNYRYLIYLVTPWSLGFGLLSSGLARRGLLGSAFAGILVVILTLGMTATMIGWYRADFGYLDADWKFVRVPQLGWNQLPIGPRRTHYVVPPDVTHVFGGYWDVYRMSFASGKKVVGIPYPMYPNRFPGWSSGLDSDHGKLLVIGVRTESRTGAPKRGSRIDFRPSDSLHAPDPNEWRSPFDAVWRNDSRDRAELDRIRVVVPRSDRAGR